MAECRFRPPKTREKKLCDQRYSEVKCASSLLNAGVDSKLVSLRTDQFRSEVFSKQKTILPH